MRVGSNVNVQVPMLCQAGHSGGGGTGQVSHVSSCNIECGVKVTLDMYYTTPHTTYYYYYYYTLGCVHH